MAVQKSQKNINADRKKRLGKHLPLILERKPKGLHSTTEKQIFSETLGLLDRSEKIGFLKQKLKITYSVDRDKKSKTVDSTTKRNDVSGRLLEFYEDDRLVFAVAAAAVITIEVVG